MRGRMKSWMLLGMALLGAAGCSSDEVVVWLHVKNVTEEMTTLEMELMLDGKPAKDKYQFKQGLGEVTFTLWKEQLGEGQLSVSLNGFRADGCKILSGKYEVTVSEEKSLAEVDVPLGTLSQVQCLLTVEKLGDVSVTSSPAGVSCGTNCTMEVAVGTKVTLTATRTDPLSAIYYYWEGCSAQADTCEVTVTTAQTVSVQRGPEVRPKLVKVPKGSFQMGSPTAESGRGTDEVQHPVTLTTDFWMAESEVTQRQYRNLMGTSPSNFDGNDLPVESVSWYNAVAYCNALSVKEKLVPCYQINGTTVGWADGVKCTGYRLPTEAEWEYAANPVTPPRTVYAGSDTADGVAWHSGNSGNTTHAVKTKTANGRGLYDLSGNVWEWVWDSYQSNYEALPASDPLGPSTGADRVIRGGAWHNTATYARVAERNYSSPTVRGNYLGFRIVRSNP